MLQKLREKTSGWIATAIIGLLVIPFLFVIDVRYIGGGEGRCSAVTGFADLVEVSTCFLANIFIVAASRD